MEEQTTSTNADVAPISEEVRADFRYWRTRVFYSMFLGYSFYYFTRKSFTFVMPAMIEELGMGKAQLGFLASLLSISYAISKFSSGILADKTNPRYLMGWGLVVTGIMNLAFGFSSSVWAFALFWTLNGVFQGFGAPPCAKLLIHWFSQRERGTWWSIWNTSHNIGGAIIPLLTGWCVFYGGWRLGMYVPGVICIFAGLWLVNRLRDTPQAMGLPSVEEMNGEKDVQAVSESESSKPSIKELLVNHVLENRLILLLGLSYFFVYMVRTGVNDWTGLYLVETKGYDALGVGGVVCWFEIGGFFGSLLAGWLSDSVFLGRRGPVNVLFMLGTLGALMGFWYFPDKIPVIDGALVFALGFLIFGPQMLVGMAAAELTDKKAAATATGFVGCFAYLGAASAGWPLGIIAQDFGWNGLFVALAVCCMIAFLLLIPLWSVGPAHARQQDRSAKKKGRVQAAA